MVENKKLRVPTKSELAAQLSPFFQSNLLFSFSQKQAAEAEKQ
jgi:hypothetical protein